MKTVKEISIDIRVVLNGGSPVMESATIPYRWFFSDSVIEQQPTDLLIIDQNAWEIEHGPDYCGERKIVPISRGSDFIQFSSPGHHRITILVLKEKKDDPQDGMVEFEKWRKGILKLNSRRQYDWCLNQDDIEKKIFKKRLGHVTASVVIEIEVPEEFFASRSNKPFGQAVWQWTNRWFEGNPRDECAYRKRMMWAFTFQPIVFIIGHLLKYIWALGSTVYLPVARIAVFCAGYRPEPLFKDIGKLWAWEWEPKNIDWSPRRHTEYRLWSEVTRVGDNYLPPKYMPITGFEIAVFGIGLPLLFLLLKSLLFVAAGNMVGKIVGCLFIFALATIVFIKFLQESEVISRTRWWNSFMTFMMKRATKKRAEKVQKQEVQKHLLYFEWLRGVCRLDQAPEKIAIKDLPTAFKGKSVQRVKIRFWAVKRKVCRPFPN